MTPDIKAAAERLRKHAEAVARKKGTGDANQYRRESPYWNGEHNSHIGQDHKVLADAYLSEHASDPSPLTPEVLERMGGKDPDASGMYSFDFGDGFGMVVFSDHPDIWGATLTQDSEVLPQDAIELPHRLRTVGDLLALCRGLGIEITAAR